MAAFYSIPKSAESLTWSTADGYDCEDTSPYNYTCCKGYTVVIGGVTLSANRCVDCNSHEGKVTCGDAYFTSSVKSPDTSVDPKVENYALDLVGQGLVMGTQDGGQVDLKVKNSAMALIGQGLSLLIKGGSVDPKVVDPKVTKDANVLLDRLLSFDKALIKAAHNTKVPKTGQDNATLPTEGGNGNTSDHTKVPKDRGGLIGNGPTINPDLQ